MKADYANVARPYAQALFSFARAQGEEEVYAECLSLWNSVGILPAGRAFLRDPLLSATDKKELLGAVAQKGQRVVPTAAWRFVDLLCEKHKLLLLPDIYQQFRVLLRAHRGELWVTVKTVCALSHTEKARIVDVLERRFAKKIIVEEERDPKIVGGFVIRIGDSVIDASLRGRLDSISEMIRK
jgi:F-type H+-transporting ATPase subunit delta